VAGSLTILERQYPEEYAQRTNVVVSGDRPIVFEHHVDVDAELARIQERLGRGRERAPLPQGSTPPSPQAEARHLLGRSASPAAAWFACAPEARVGVALVRRVGRLSPRCRRFAVFPNSRPKTSAIRSLVGNG
jgi:hypothetical protein